MDWIVQNIFKLAPLLDQHEEAKNRASNPNLIFLRALAIAVSTLNRLNQAITATNIVDICTENSLDIHGLKDQTDDDKAKKQIGRIMSNLFAAKDQITNEGYSVIKTEKSSTNDNGNYQTYKNYTFALVGEVEPSSPPSPLPEIRRDVTGHILSGVNRIDQN